MRILKSIQKFEQEFDIKAAKFIWRHPILGFLSIFVGMPVFVLVCVCISTVLITVPMAWFFGWLQSLYNFKTAAQCLTPFLEKRNYHIPEKEENIMEFMIAVLGICAAAMLLWYVYILMKGDGQA